MLVATTPLGVVYHSVTQTSALSMQHANRSCSMRCSVSILNHLSYLVLYHQYQTLDLIRFCISTPPSPLLSFLLVQHKKWSLIAPEMQALSTHCHCTLVVLWIIEPPSSSFISSPHAWQLTGVGRIVNADWAHIPLLLGTSSLSCRGSLLRLLRTPS